MLARTVRMCEPSARAQGLSAPRARTREQDKDFVHESCAEGAYERFYSRVHAHFARGERTPRFLCRPSITRANVSARNTHTWAVCARAGLSAPRARTREKDKDFVHESCAEGEYERFYSRVHAHFVRGVHTRRFLCASRMSGVLINSRRVCDPNWFPTIDFI